MGAALPSLGLGFLIFRGAGCPSVVQELPAWGTLLNPAGPWVPSHTNCSGLDGVNLKKCSVRVVS